MAARYYINHDGYSDSLPHWGEYDDQTQEMATGKHYKKLFESSNKQAAEVFLMDKFGVEWEL